MKLQISKTNYDKEREMSHLKRFIGVMLFPKKTLDDIVKAPSILIPGIVVALGFLVLGIGRFPIFRDVYLADLTNNLSLPERNKIAYLRLLISPADDLGGWVVFSGIYFVFVKLLKGKGTYRQILSMNGYIYIYKIIYYISCAFVSFKTGELFYQDSIVILLPFLKAFKGTYFYGYLNATSIITFFEYIVAAIGLQKISKLDKKYVYCIVFIPYLIALITDAPFAMNL